MPVDRWAPFTSEEQDLISLFVQEASDSCVWEGGNHLVIGGGLLSIAGTFRPLVLSPFTTTA